MSIFTFLLPWRQVLWKIKWRWSLSVLFSDPFAQLEHENQRTGEPDPGSLWLCLYFGIWETFPVSRPGHLPWARWLPVGQNLSVPFSVHTHAQMYTLFLRRKSGHVGQSVPTVYLIWIVWACQKACLSCNLHIFGMTFTWLFSLNFKWISSLRYREP